MGRDNDYSDWENNEESESFGWRHNVEYVMTNKGLERVDKMKDEDENRDENSNETIEQFRKSKEQMEREKEQKLRELQEIDKELQKVDSTAKDSTRYHYRSTVPATTLVHPKKTIKKDEAMAITDVPGISDMLMVRFAL
jgi:hypothetical protein